MNAIVQQAVKAATNLVAESNDFSASNWYYRRIVIMGALLISAIIVIVIAGVIAASIVVSVMGESARSFDANLLRLAETLLWTTFTFAGGIIGTYVFGANWDTKDYRKAVVEMQKTPIETKTTTTVATSVVKPTETVDTTTVTEDKSTAGAAQPEDEPVNPDAGKEDKKGAVG